VASYGRGKLLPLYGNWTDGKILQGHRIVVIVVPEHLEGLTASLAVGELTQRGLF